MRLCCLVAVVRVRDRCPKGRESRWCSALGPLGGKYRRRVSENMLACFRIRAEYLCRESPPLRGRVRPVPKTVAAYAKDESVRLQSSSGGIFTVLAERILDDGGGVVGVAQTAPTRFRSGKSVSVHHGRSKYMRLFLSRICQNTSCDGCHYRKLPRIAGNPCIVRSSTPHPKRARKNSQTHRRTVW